MGMRRYISWTLGRTCTKWISWICYWTNWTLARSWVLLLRPYVQRLLAWALRWQLDGLKKVDTALLVRYTVSTVNNKEPEMIRLKLTEAQAETLEVAVEAAMNSTADTGQYIAYAELLNLIREAEVNSTPRLTTNF
jgi:ABC-type tungstate transport system permease subunit